MHHMTKGKIPLTMGKTPLSPNLYLDQTPRVDYHSPGFTHICN